MTETLNDSNPNHDTLASLRLLDEVRHSSDIEDDEDVFICRKCNKIFKNLPEYLEHKVKDENYRISQMRSKMDKRMVLPQLVQKRKKTHQKAKCQKSGETQEAYPTKKGPVDDKERTHIVATNDTENETEASTGLEKPADQTHVQNAYICQFCDRSFRREATLRWHVKCDHSKKEEGVDNSDSSDVEVKEERDFKDEDFNVKEAEREESEALRKDNEDENYLSKGKDVDTKEIHIVIQNGDKSPGPGRTKNNKQTAQKQDGSVERPFACEICGRAFKELIVLKSHAIVHSDERKYICKVDNCPYGFKTKGCLVRHMRRHTGERPFECHKCKRSFAESGALTRHLKARRNCAEMPDFPRYKKSWSYHPNIPAVIDPTQRDTQRTRSSTALEELKTDLVQEVKLIITEDQLQSPVVQAGRIVSQSNEPGENVDIKLELGNNMNVSELGEVTSVGNTEVVSTLIRDGGSLSATDKMNLPNLQCTDISEIRQALDIEGLKPTQCHVCQKDFEAIEGLEIHLRSHLADEQAHCGLCHFISNDREELRKHILSMHYDSLNDIEASVLSSESNVTEKDGNKKKTNLRDALTAVKQLYNLKKGTDQGGEGSSNPSTAGISRCMVCNRTFRGSSYLRQHMRMHTGDRPYQCQFCNSRFTTRDILKKHMYVHTDNRNYECGECGKLFKRLAHVQQHVRIHNHDRSFRCTICDKLFKSHNSLKVHLRTHTGINPYKCHVCSRHFRERGSLQRHLRLHSGEKPYVCPHCHRAFAEQGTLSRHLKAKMPCSANRDPKTDSASANNTMLAQFSNVVADTQQYMVSEADQQFVLPECESVSSTQINSEYMILDTTEEGSEEVIENIEVIAENDTALTEPTSIQDASSEQVESDSTETLQIFDASTGESVIIVADKSIVDLVKDNQLSFTSSNMKTSIEKIKEMLIAAEEGGTTAMASEEDNNSTAVVMVADKNETVETDIVQPLNSESDLKVELVTETHMQIEQMPVRTVSLTDVDQASTIH